MCHKLWEVEAGKTSILRPENLHSPGGLQGGGEPDRFEKAQSSGSFPTPIIGDGGFLLYRVKERESPLPTHRFDLIYSLE